MGFVEDLIELKRRGFITLTPQHKALGMLCIKQLGDVQCGIKAMVATWALMVKVNTVDEVNAECERRYCYPHPDAAFRALIDYTDINEHPTGQWIKCKGKMNGQMIDLLNPNWSRS